MFAIHYATFVRLKLWLRVVYSVNWDPTAMQFWSELVPEQVHIQIFVGLTCVGD